MPNRTDHASPAHTAVFDLQEIAAGFPRTAGTMLIDTRLTDEPHASARVFRVYRPVAAHYHAACDEYLVVLSGRAKFFLGEAPPFEALPGQLIFFKQGTIHGTPEILEEPFVVLAVDTPRRDPSDVHFVNPADGTPESFIEATASIESPQNSRATHIINQRPTHKAWKAPITHDR